MSFLSISNIFKNEQKDGVNKLPYDLRFSEIGIEKIIKDLPLIEQEIINDIHLISLNFLEKKGAQIKGDIFDLDNQKYKIHIELIKAERKLLIKFAPVINSKYSSIVSNHLINGFGSIKSFQINYPYYIRKDFNKLVITIEQQLTFAYLSLQKKFELEFRSFGESIFNELYSFINIEIERQNKHHLIGKFYFNVTFRSNKKFRYFFDHNNLRILINHFNLNQSLEFSPIEMLIVLIIEEASDTLNMLIEVEEDNFDFINSNDYVSQEQNIKFWVSESLLVNNKELASYTIAKTEKLIFQVGCIKELEKEFKSVFKITKNSLSEKFKDNVNSYIKHTKALTKIPKPTLPTSLRMKTSEWLGSFVGNAMYSFIKKAGRP